MADQQAFDKEKFNSVCALTYKQQCVFFLNAFWTEHGADANNVYTVYKKFLELDNNNTSGSSLDELNSHRLLEAFGEPLTVIKVREIYWHIYSILV